MAQLVKYLPASNVGDLGLIPRLGRSPGEGKGYPLQYSWASLEAHMVKNLPAMQETLGLFLGLGRSPGKRNGTHSSILAWKIPWTEEPGRLQFMESQRAGHD